MLYDGVSAKELAARLCAAECLLHERVPSVLDVVHEVAAHGAPNGAVVLADEQTAGRGRLGRRWHSPPGCGIWLGFLMRPPHRVEGGVLALRVGIAVAETLDGMGVSVKLKWPNDIVVQDRKLAGVLCEARWRDGRPSWVAVGIGINVHGPLAEEVRDSAVTLDEVLTHPSRVAVLERLLPALCALPTASHLSEHECTTYARIDWLAGRRLVEPVPGVAEGVSTDGALLVKTAAGVERILGGGVVPA